MNKKNIRIRLLEADDFDAVVRIDEKVIKTSRSDYYKVKFEKLVRSKDYLPTSLVAEGENGKVIGFIMGELYIGEYGISQEKASLDSIGVDPSYQNMSIGKNLIDEFINHMKSLGVRKVNTLVDWDNAELIHFFSANQFSPSKIINLERSI